MAQETAGTIGIPVLRNEILPYMTDFKRRQDRYAALEAQRAAKLADLEYKKQQERNKAYGTSLPGVSGNYYSDINLDMQKGDLDKITQMAGNPNVPNADLFQMAAQIKTENETRNNFATQRSKEIDDMRKQAETYGVSVNPGLIGSHLATRYQSSPIRNSQFFQESDSEQILDQALGDINNVNLGRLGQTMIGKSKPKSEEIETLDRQKTKFEYYDVFIPKRVKGTVATGDAFMAGPVDINRADQIFEGEPIARKIRDRAVMQMVTANQKDPAFAALTVEEQNKEAKQAFYDQVFANYKGQTQYVRSLEQGRKGGKGGGKTPIDIEQPIGIRSIEFPVTNQQGAEDKQQATIGSPTDRVFTYSKQYNHPAGVAVYLLQSPKDPDTQKIVSQRPDGTYTLKSGFKYSDPIKSEMYFAKEDINFFGGKPANAVGGKPQPLYTVKKGTPLDNTTAIGLIRKGKGNLVNKQIGYDVTATIATPVGENKDEPIFRTAPTVRLFIPEKNGGVIKTHINMEKRKVDTFDIPGQKMGDQEEPMVF
jgi:hypothetical protein